LAASLVAVTIAAASASPALAADGELTIVGEGDRTWDDILREIQDHPDTQGAVYALGVRTTGVTHPCNEYTLSFDDVGRAAFAIEGCDPATRMTRIRVLSRAALFEEGSRFVPRPRRATVYAVLVARGSAEGGGAPPEGGSRVGCSVRLEPYLWDGLRGRAVPLPWDRFELRPLSEEVHAAPDGAGWIARGESHMSVRFRYEVVDRVTGERVVDNEATLSCHDGPAEGPARSKSSDPKEKEAAVSPRDPPGSPPLVPPGDALARPAGPTPAGDHSVASLKLGIAELGLLRNDSPRFRGIMQLALYNGASDFAGAFQIGITNTAGVYPWGRPDAGRAAAASPPAAAPVAFRGAAQVGVIDLVDGGFSGGLQVGAVAGVDGPFRGIAQIGLLAAGFRDGAALMQVGGLFTLAEDITGVELAGCLAMSKTVRGIQVGACGAMVFGSLEGLQIGAVNMAFTPGKRHGPPEPDARVDGAQIGPWNYAQRLRGAQVGVFNVASTASGVQLGAVNYAGHLDGIQIGVINVAPNGVVPFMPIANAAFD
jgi:hypothetical protein